MDEKLLERSIHYHGRLLVSFLEENGVLKSKDISSHLNNHRGGRPSHSTSTLALKQFIAQNVSSLFSRSSFDDVPSKKKNLSDLNIASSAITPPLETFSRISPQDRISHFFNSVELHDLLLCRVRSKRSSDAIPLYVESFAQGQKSRLLDDLFIKAYCPMKELPSVSLSPGDTVLAYVIDIERHSESIIVGMNPPSDIFEGLSFGPLQSSSSEFSAAHKLTLEAKNEDTPFALFLEESSGFKNPSNVEYLADELGLSFQCSSLIPSLKNRYPESDYASSLRAKQAHQWAFKSVESGIQYLKSGNNIEAFQCLNQAISIDAKNVEGLVARGALFANVGNYKKAILDFEKALSEEPSHKNAKEYMCETLMALAKDQESKKKDGDPTETYKKVLSYDPDHAAATHSIKLLKESLENKCDTPSKNNDGTKFQLGYEYEQSVNSFLERTQSQDNRRKKSVGSRQKGDSPQTRRRSTFSSGSSSPSPMKKTKYRENEEIHVTKNGERFLSGECVSQRAQTSFTAKDRTRSHSAYVSDSSSSRIRSRSRSKSSSSSKKKRKSRKSKKKKSRARSSTRSPSDHRHRKSSTSRKRSRSREDTRRHRQKHLRKSIEDDLEGIQSVTNRIDREREEIESRRLRFLRPVSDDEEREPLNPSSIIPGQSNLDDVVAFVDQKRRDKMDQLKKNYM